MLDKIGLITVVATCVVLSSFSAYFLGITQGHDLGVKDAFEKGNCIKVLVPATLGGDPVLVEQVVCPETV